MAVSPKSISNLKSGKNKKWRHMPTQAIRVPAVFAQQLLEIARKLDSESIESGVQQNFRQTNSLVINGYAQLVDYHHAHSLGLKQKIGRVGTIVDQTDTKCYVRFGDEIYWIRHRYLRPHNQDSRLERLRINSRYPYCLL